jgi:hypothetical protein
MKIGNLESGTRRAPLFCMHLERRAATEIILERGSVLYQLRAAVSRTVRRLLAGEDVLEELRALTLAEERAALELQEVMG